MFFLASEDAREGRTVVSDQSLSGEPSAISEARRSLCSQDESHCLAQAPSKDSSTTVWQVLLSFPPFCLIPGCLERLTAKYTLHPDKSRLSGPADPSAAAPADPVRFAGLSSQLSSRDPHRLTFFGPRHLPFHMEPSKNSPLFPPPSV